ncbi:MAG: cyclic nucleotide-binding domain-containing protein [Candidatus Kapabacteria bacterium]|nr:cyclic nucleotide-binding domain-containing protein [Candidatus Kapabacteria bacterium]
MLKPVEFDMLTPEQISKINSYMEPFTFSEGEFIYRAGEAGQRGYIVDEGEVRFEIPNEELDSERVLEIVPPGVLLGESVLLGINEHKVNAVANSPVKARGLSRDALERMRSEDPELT